MAADSGILLAKNGNEVKEKTQQGHAWEPI
jgi:hypothetical protein